MAGILQTFSSVYLVELHGNCCILMWISLNFVPKGLIKPVFIQKHGLMLNKWWEAIIWNNGGLVYCCTYASYASMSWCAECLFLAYSALISGLWPWFPMILRWFLCWMVISCTLSSDFRPLTGFPMILRWILMFLWCLQKETRQIWGIWKLRLAYSPETPNLGQNRWCFVPCDLEIWRMTLENDRASLLCCFKLCATFHSHWWIKTGVTVRKRPIWVKFDDF